MGFDKLSVLVVDDDKFMRDLIARSLKQIGVTKIVEAEEGAATSSSSEAVYTPPVPPSWVGANYIESCGTTGSIDPSSFCEYSGARSVSTPLMTGLAVAAGGVLVDALAF